MPVAMDADGTIPIVPFIVKGPRRHTCVMERSPTGIARNKTLALRPPANKTPIVMYRAVAWEKSLGQPPPKTQSRK